MRCCLNHAYSRNNFWKIRSSIKVWTNSEYLSTFNPIGYKKEPDIHNRLISDEVALFLP